MNTNYPKTRAEAKRIGSKYYFTGEPCKYGHIALRIAKGTCTECQKIEWAKDYDKRREYFTEYNNRTAVKEGKHKWYEENKQAVIDRAKTTPLCKRREYQKTWKENNVVWCRADAKSRRRKHREATPKWITQAQKREIREIYKIAITMTKTTGEQYVVDHIVPLRSEIVCGLHVPWNLRVITQAENLEKSNKLDESHTV